MLRQTALVVLVGLALGGCGDSGSDSADIGHAGNKANASRVVEIRQLDSLRFEPSKLDVKPDETVTLRITNTATTIHELFLGNKRAQDERQKLMSGMGSSPMNMADLANGVTVDPGATKELTWTFPRSGKVEFGCHEPGHYAKGMEGEVTVKN